MFTDSAHKHYPDHIAPPNDSSLGLMAELVGSSKRVLDVGCANGSLARSLVAQGCSVVGVDVSASAAASARLICVDVLIADLDLQPLSQIASGHAPFDVVVFGDVLEHLRNPLTLLENSRSLLAENGYVVVSIPNIAHGAVRLAMMSGGFDYQEYGLLDETHLRFFTLRTIESLLDSAGFRVETLSRTHAPMFQESDLVPAVRREDYAPEVLEAVLRDPEHETLQFVIRAYPISDDARLRVLAKRASDAQAEREAAQRRAEALSVELEGLRAAHRKTSDRLQELDRERALHLAARDRADRVIEASAERITEMQRRIEQMESDVREIHDDERRIAAKLSEAQARNAELEARRAILEDDLARQAAEYESLREEADGLRADLSAAAQERDVLVAQNDALAAQHEALECRFVDLIDEMTAKMRAEAESLAAEVDSVQSGAVWRVRKALRSLLRKH